jgi:GntR family transcriptional regulator
MSAVRIGKRTGVTRYHLVYTLLSRELADGTIPAGSALPTELELMRRYQVSRNTIRHALARLEREKRIIRRRGSGTIARQVESTLPSGGVIPIPDDRQFEAPGATAKILQYGKTLAPGCLRERWPSYSAEVLLVQRLWSLQRLRVALCTLLVEQSAARRLRRAQLGAKSIYTLLSGAGCTFGKVFQTCRAVQADAIIAGQLDLMPGAALLVVTRWVQDSQDRPLLYQQLTYRGDTYELSSEPAL